MRLTGFIATLSLLFILIFMFSGCGGGGTTSVSDGSNVYPVLKPQGGERAAASYFSDTTPGDPMPWRWSLIFDYGDPTFTDRNWGAAELVNVGGVWFMKYTLSSEYLALGWRFIGAHVWVGTAPPNANKGGVPGKYPYKWVWNGTQGDMRESYMLKLGTWTPPSGPFYLAIHAVVGQWGSLGYWDDDNDPLTPDVERFGLVDDETGWGGYWGKTDEAGDWEDHWTNKWGGWIYTGTAADWSPVFEPALDKAYMCSHYGPDSYWSVTFQTQDWYPFPGSNNWVGWCADPQVIYNGLWYYADVFSSYDPDMPAYAESNNWEFISYMINMRRCGIAPFNEDWTDQYWKDAFQEAVWYFKRGLIDYTPAPSAQVFINDAVAHGDNYVPLRGDYYAVILWVKSCQYNYRPYINYYPEYESLAQMNIIEVDP